MRLRPFYSVWVLLNVVGSALCADVPSVLPGTNSLPVAPEWREEQRQQILRYLDRKITASAAERDRQWAPALRSRVAMEAFAVTARARIATMVGFETPVISGAELESMGGGGNLRIDSLELTGEDHIHARALLLRPKSPAAT